MLVAVVVFCYYVFCLCFMMLVILVVFGIWFFHVFPTLVIVSGVNIFSLVISIMYPLVHFHIAMANHHAIHEKLHYFDKAIFHGYVTHGQGVYCVSPSLRTIVCFECP